MLMLLSPSKTMDEKHATPKAFTPPIYAQETKLLVELLQKKNTQDLQTLMDISPAIATLNQSRYASWESAQAYTALELFKGDVYEGLGAQFFTDVQRNFAHQHLRILSGLYGVIAPLDSIRPYRLEMGIGLTNPQGKHLYDFWGEKVTDAVNHALEASGSDELINLASQEYAKAVKTKKIKGKIVQIEFRVKKNATLKSIGIYAKRARGLLAKYVITNGLTRSEQLLDFAEEGYAYAPELSAGHTNTLFFIKELA